MTEAQEQETRAPSLLFWIVIAVGFGFGLAWLVKPGGPPEPRQRTVARGGGV